MAWKLENIRKDPNSKDEYAGLFISQIKEEPKTACLFTIGDARTVEIILEKYKNTQFVVFDYPALIKFLEFAKPANLLKATPLKYDWESEMEFLKFVEELQNYNINNMSFDLIIANPPYGKSSGLAQKIIPQTLKVASQVVCLAPTNSYKIPELKYVQSIVRVEGHVFEDASIYDLCITRMTKEVGPYEDYASLVLEKKSLGLYKSIKRYNEEHSTHFKVEKDFMGCKKDWNRMFAFSYAINNGGSTCVKSWNEVVDLTQYTEKHQGPTADIKFNFGNDFEVYYNNLKGNVSYPRLIDMNSSQERNNFKNWYYKAGKLVNTIRSIISQCENITPKPQCYIDYFPQVDWSHSWTDEEILKEIGLPENFLEKEE